MSNQLDNLFKNKLQNRSFDYDESAWEDARLLIEKEERRKKKRRFAFIFAGMFLLFSVGFSAYYIGKSTVVVPSIENAIQTAPTVIAGETKQSVTAPSAVVDKSIASLDQQGLEAIEINNVNSSKLSNEEKPNAKKTFANQISNSNKKSLKGTDTNNKSNYIDAEEGVVNTALSYSPVTTDYNPMDVASATPKHTQIEKETTRTNLDMNFIPVNSLSLLQTSNENLAGLVNLLPALQKAVEGAPIESPKNKWFFGIRGGTTLIPNVFNDFEGGVELGYLLNRNWSIAVQPKYQYQTLSENTIGESTEENFGFGLRSSAFSLQAETIRSIHLPLVLSYSFGNKSFDLDDKPSDRYLRNKVSFGLSYVFLDGITGVILQKETAGEQSEFQSGWLPSDNFNRHNAEILLGYDRYLNKRLAIGFQAKYRMRDQFAENFSQQFPDIVAPSPFYLGLQTSIKLF